MRGILARVWPPGKAGLAEVVESAEDGTKGGMADERHQGCLVTVVEGEEAGWFQLARDGRSLLFARHPGMDAGH